jgi:prepilin-type N-terminal cleavage/methylation domain-containing protein
MNKINKAFSLIELSIVVLIIGILIAGVTQGSRMVQQARIKTAQNQTSSAAASSIPGLVLWLETTTSGTVVSATNGTDAENGDNVMGWNDINTQTLTKNNVSRATNNSNITYLTNAINGLPAINFNGTVSATTSLNGTVINNPANNFTFFVVSKTNDNSAATFRNVFSNGTLGTGGFAYAKNRNSPFPRDLVLIAVSDNVTSGTISTDPEVICGVYNGTNINLFVNGTQDALTPSTGTSNTPTGSLYIGNCSTGNCPWQGLIGEIIIYDHALKTSERKAVEGYLSKKWSITVAP